MEALQAVVLTHAQLREMLTEVAKQGAAMAVAELHADIHQTPDEATLQQLRAYLADPGTLSNPRDRWAHSGLIRQIQPTACGKSKSAAWFMKFQRETGLHECFTRQSPAFWKTPRVDVIDIKLARDTYYRK